MSSGHVHVLRDHDRRRVRATSAIPVPAPTTSRRRSRASPRPAARRSSRQAPAASRASAGSPSRHGRGAGSGCNPGASQAELADRHRLHGPLVCGHLGGRRPRHRDAGLRLRRRRLGRRRRDQRGLAADRGLLRTARVGRRQGPSWAYANASLLNDPTSGSNGTCSASISYICNAGPGLRRPDRRRQHLGRGRGGAPGIAGPGTNGSYAQTVTAELGPAPGRGVPERRGHHVLVGVRHDHRLRPADPRERHRLGHRSGAGDRLAHRPVARDDLPLPAGRAEQPRHRVRLRLHADHAGHDGELAHPGPEPDDHPVPPTTTTTSSPPVTGTGGSGGRGTRRPARRS